MNPLILLLGAFAVYKLFGSSPPSGSAPATGNSAQAVHSTKALGGKLYDLWKWPTDSQGFQYIVIQPHGEDYWSSFLIVQGKLPIPQKTTGTLAQNAELLKQL